MRHKKTGFIVIGFHGQGPYLRSPSRLIKSS